MKENNFGSASRNCSYYRCLFIGLASSVVYYLHMNNNIICLHNVAKPEPMEIKKQWTEH